MPRPLPPKTQAIDGQAHARPGALEMVNLLQILAQQWGRPHGRAIAQLARVPLDHLHDQRIELVASYENLIKSCYYSKLYENPSFYHGTTSFNKRTARNSLQARL